MAYWVYVVIILVVGLVIYEMISWIIRRMRPASEQASEDAKKAAEAQAELTRANMKIAVLERRLEAEEIKHEDEQAALEAKHKEHIVKTEAAYQRQMVALSERLAKNGKGDWRVAAEREKDQKRAESEQYPVRMAAEIAAWKGEAFGEEPGVDTAVSEDEATSTKDNDMSIDRPDPAVRTLSEETADPNSPVEYEVIGVPQSNGVAASVAAISGLDLSEIEATVEDEYGRLEDAPEEIRDAADAQAVEEPSISPAAAMSLHETAGEEETWQPDHDEEVLDQITVHGQEDISEGMMDFGEAESGEPDVDAGEVDSAELDTSKSAGEAESGEPDVDAGESAAEAEDPIDYFGNQWPDHDDPAMQRVMARRLASEMDADYLDDDEFLKEMGIEQFTPEQFPISGEAAEDIMGGENWVTDPIEELSFHLNGEPTDEAEADASEAIMEDAVERPDPSLEVSDEAWEEMVYVGETVDIVAQAGQAADENEATDEAEAEASFDDASFDEEETIEEELPSIPPELEPGTEDAAIAATVAAILSRAPNGPDKDHADPDQESFMQVREDAVGEEYDAPFSAEPAEEVVLAGVPDENGSATNGNGAAKRPSLQPYTWQREPILWEAEYYANTGLAEQPAVVRKDKDIDFEWRGMSPAQGIEPRSFSVRWTGLLPLGQGQYRFTAAAPDGMRLWLNDRLVISAWYDQSEQTYQREFYWNGGSIDVRMEHYENGGDAKAYLTWERVA